MSKTRKTIGIDFKEDVKINRFSLETECEIQAEMYYHYSELLAKKKPARDKARAAKELDIRQNPGAYVSEGTKLTEAYVEALIKNDGELNKLNEEVLLLEAACSSLEDRSKQLKNLTELFQSGYYSVYDGMKKSGNSEAEDHIRGHLKRKSKEDK